MNLELVTRVSGELGQILTRLESDSEAASAPLTGSKCLSASNLRCYMKFRGLEISGLQTRLGALGLSRFARAEGHILYSVCQVRNILQKLRGAEIHPVHARPDPEEALQILSENTSRLLGPGLPDRRMMIMVTLPTEAASDPSITRELVARGMNCARINCAHDSESTWKSMIEHVRKAANDHKREVRIAMDLGGPKLRTHEVSGDLLDKKGNACLMLYPGDELILAAGMIKPNDGSPVVTLSLPAVLQDVREGERVFFDDGKIETIVTDSAHDLLRLKVIRCKTHGSRLRVDKGINFPDSTLRISGLTAKDQEDLSFIAAHADIVNFSFVNTVDDLHKLFAELDKYQAGHLGIILKIETKRAYNHLSSLLLETMMVPNPVGVMIARGDLAVEAGWENIGYIQREILRICTAALIPIVWATQVLENLAKKGTPSRSEMTDIVQSLKADCVMLNKGPYINDTLGFLNNFLIRSESFQQKNLSMLPSLRELRGREV